jgi:hypothetical protein
VTRDTLRYLRKKLRQAVAGCIYVWQQYIRYSPDDQLQSHVYST